MSVIAVCRLNVCVFSGGMANFPFANDGPMMLENTYVHVPRNPCSNGIWVNLTYI